MEEGPTQAEQDERASYRLIKDHLNGVKNVKFEVLVTTFKDCQEADDVYKLGICVFGMRYLLGREHNKSVNDEYISMVEGLPFFYSLPWGNINWTEAYASLSVNSLKYYGSQHIKLEKEDVLQKVAKYMLSGNMHAF